MHKDVSIRKYNKPYYILLSGKIQKHLLNAVFYHINMATHKQVEFVQSILLRNNIDAPIGLHKLLRASDTGNLTKYSEVME